MMLKLWKVLKIRKIPINSQCIDIVPDYSYLDQKETFRFRKEYLYLEYSYHLVSSTSISLTLVDPSIPRTLQKFYISWCLGCKSINKLYSLFYIIPGIPCVFIIFHDRCPLGRGRHNVKSICIVCLWLCATHFYMKVWSTQRNFYPMVSLTHLPHLDFLALMRCTKLKFLKLT